MGGELCAIIPSVKETSHPVHSQHSVSHTPKVRDFHGWDKSRPTAGSFREPACLHFDSTHTPLTRSQTRFPYWLSSMFPLAESQLSQFHKDIYSQCINTETPRAGASKEDPQQRNPWAFLPSQSTHAQVSLFLLRLPLLLCLPVSI